MRKVITYGTFDLFHQGHYNILKRAKAEGDYLVVGITGESYDVERGKLSVQDSLATRIENVRKTGFADLIIVEEYLGQKIQDIIRYDIDVLVVGSDWKGKFDHLRKYCEVKYLERTKNISSTQIREEKMANFKFGIATDDLYDGEAVIEPKHVSGIHLESVYSQDPKVSKEFCEKYELDSGYNDYDDFLRSVDIVYIKTGYASRYEYAKRALLQKKHVICDSPIILDWKKESELFSIAHEHNLALYNNLPILHLQAFGQLLWNARGNLIGDLISIKCSISKQRFDAKKDMDFFDLAIYPICLIVKLLGIDYEKISYKLVPKADGTISYGMLMFMYRNTLATAEISFNQMVGMDGSMQIIGTDGMIFVPNDWWRIGYFKVKRNDEPDCKRYSFNFEGNGFRYLVQDLLSLIRENRTRPQQLQWNERKAVMEILSDIRRDLPERP